MGDKKDEEKDKRPSPPEKVDNPLPLLAEAMKSLGAMQVAITKAVDELDIKRQADYIAAVEAWEKKTHGGKAKEEEDKAAAEVLHNKREVARLKAKLLVRPCQPTPELHSMAIPSVIELVLKNGDFKKDDLQNFCLICKAWVLPVRSLMFANLTDLKVQSKQRADALIELLTARQALITVIKAMTFTFQPSDPSVPKAVALRESLPSPLQFILLLTLCAEAKQLNFENMATFGATRVVLHHIADRIEKCTIDPKGYAWHSKEVEFGTDGQRAMFGSWKNLKEISLARIVLKIHSSDTYARGLSDSTYPAKCPLQKLKMEKVRLLGRLVDVLDGARGHLTQLSLLSIGSLFLKDLCMVLTDHGATLTHLTLAACEIKDADAAPDDDDDFGNNNNWGNNNGGNWSAGQRARHGAFDRALSACMNLVHLSIEPGSYPVYNPSALFRPFEKLESLEFNMRNAGGYDYSAWHTLLGLVPVLLDEKRKLKKIHFGHDWNSDDRRLHRLRTEWTKHAEEVKIARLPRVR